MYHHKWNFSHLCMSVKILFFQGTEHYNLGHEHILTNCFLFSLVFPPQRSSQRGFSCPAPLEPSRMPGPTHHNRPPHFWPNMELKVWVDGVQRVVCGVTEATTCQEVVIALAQAIGKSCSNTFCFIIVTTISKSWFLYLFWIDIITLAAWCI